MLLDTVRELKGHKHTVAFSCGLINTRVSQDVINHLTCERRFTSCDSEVFLEGAKNLGLRSAHPKTLRHISYI